MKTKFIITCYLIAAFSFSLKAQDQTQQPKQENKTCANNPYNKSWGVNVNFGSTLFYGDLRQYDYYPLGSKAKYAVSERKIGYGIAVNKSFCSAFALQGRLLNGQLSGTSRKWGQYFKTNFTEVALEGIVNFNSLVTKKENKVNFYGLVGLGYTSFHSIARSLELNSPDEANRFIAGEGYDKTGAKTTAVGALSIPFGFGFNIRMANNVFMNIESAFRKTNSDKLDSHVGAKNDWYQYTSIGITYKFNFSSAKYDKNTTPAVSEQKPVEVKPTEVKPVEEPKPAVVEEKKVEPTPVVVEKQAEAKPAEVKPVVTPVKEDKTAEEKTGKEATDYFPVPESSVMFDFNSAVIQNVYAAKIEYAVKYMKEHPDTKITLEGHCDKFGSEAVNQKLGEQRSSAVKNMIIKKYGIDAKRVVVVSKGKKELLSPTEHKLNRRVDFKVVK